MLPNYLNNQLFTVRTFGVIASVVFIILLYAIYATTSARTSRNTITHANLKIVFRLHWRRITICIGLTFVLALASISLVQDPATLGFAPPAVARIVVEKWSVYNLIAAQAIMILLSYVTLPFLANPVRGSMLAGLAKVSPLIGIFLAPLCLGLLSGSLFFLPGWIVILPVVVAVFIAIIRAMLPEGTAAKSFTILLQRSFLATMLVLSPIIFVPMSSTFTIGLAAVTLLFMILFIFMAVRLGVRG